MAAAVLAALHAGPAIVIGRSTGGLIAIELARRFLDKVKALVLLEPALFTIDQEAEAWARNLRQGVLEQCAGQGGHYAEAVVREALGESTTPEDSPEACRLVNARLSGASPFTHTLLVTGGHLIDPAHQAVLTSWTGLAPPQTPGCSQPPTAQAILCRSCGPRHPVELCGVCEIGHNVHHGALERGAGSQRRA